MRSISAGVISMADLMFVLVFYVSLCFLFFFFQAEDGIRDVAVTGVQTCALPISRAPSRASSRTWARPARASRSRRYGRPSRSEERRVGKECRSRWAADH